MADEERDPLQMLLQTLIEIQDTFGMGTRELTNLCDEAIALLKGEDESLESEGYAEAEDSADDIKSGKRTKKKGEFSLDMFKDHETIIPIALID